MDTLKHLYNNGYSTSLTYNIYCRLIKAQLNMYVGLYVGVGRGAWTLQADGSSREGHEGAWIAGRRWRALSPNIKMGN